MRGLFEGWHIIILILLVVLLFGFKRLPDAARSLGRSARIFKSEVDEMKNDGTSAASSDTVRGETIGRERGEDPAAPPAPPSPVQENVPRTDNQSGPVA